MNIRAIRGTQKAKAGTADKSMNIRAIDYAELRFVAENTHRNEAMPSFLQKK